MRKNDDLTLTLTLFIITLLIIIAFLLYHMMINKKEVTRVKNNCKMNTGGCNISRPPKRYVAIDKPLTNYFNIATRGVTNFRQIGVLSAGNNVVLPLYGKQTHRGSYKWYYYTNAIRGHKYLNLPIKNKNIDCMDDYGCDELYDGDTVDIPVYNNLTFTVHVYDYLSRPHYNPHGGLFL